MTHAQVLIQASGTTRAVEWVKAAPAPPPVATHIEYRQADNPAHEREARRNDKAVYEMTRVWNRKAAFDDATNFVFTKHAGALKALAEYDGKGEE